MPLTTVLPRVCRRPVCCTAMRRLPPSPVLFLCLFASQAATARALAHAAGDRPRVRRLDRHGGPAALALGRDRRLDRRRARARAAPARPARPAVAGAALVALGSLLSAAAPSFAALASGPGRARGRHRRARGGRASPPRVSGRRPTGARTCSPGRSRDAGRLDRRHADRGRRGRSRLAHDVRRGPGAGRRGRARAHPAATARRARRGAGGRRRGAQRVARFAGGELLANAAWASVLTYSGALLLASYDLTPATVALGLGLTAVAMLPGTFMARRHAARATPALLISLTLVQGGAVVVLGAVRPSPVLTLGLLACDGVRQRLALDGRQRARDGHRARGQARRDVDARRRQPVRLPARRGRRRPCARVRRLRRARHRPRVPVRGGRARARARAAPEPTARRARRGLVSRVSALRARP